MPHKNVILYLPSPPTDIAKTKRPPRCAAGRLMTIEKPLADALGSEASRDRNEAVFFCSNDVLQIRRS
jgi:hypothetical protein